MRLLSPEAEVTRSLSNLFKPWSVQTVTSDARVIDSNERMMEYFKKNPPQTMKQEISENEEDSFVGADIENSEPEIDHVALAKEEAERILADANAKAEELITCANERVGEIEDTARTQGYEAEDRSGWRRSLRQSHRRLRRIMRAGFPRLRRITAVSGIPWSMR